MNNTTSQERVLTILKMDEMVMAMLRAVRDTGLPNSWIGAGCIRNAVWNALFAQPHPVPPTDIDCIYFERKNDSPEQDHKLEKSFRQMFPGTTWEVKNQAHMHEKNGDAPYQSVEDALARWPETATAIAARLDENDHLHLLAPFGVEDLVRGIIRKSPQAKQESFERRLREKHWKEKWPVLTIVDKG